MYRMRNNPLTRRRRSSPGAISTKKMTFDNILEEVNGFGLFQITNMILLYTPLAALPCHLLLNNFIAVVPPHHCDTSILDNGLFRNLTEEQRLTVSVPVGEDGSPKSCEMFAEPQYQLLANSSNSTDLPTIQCQSGWVYDDSHFSSGIAREWDLVCDRKSQLQILSTVIFIGVMVGAPIFGYFSDKYGRRRSLLAAYIMTIACGLSSAFANSSILFAILRFFTGTGLAGMTTTSVVLSIEWVDISHRSFSSVIGSLSWSIGNMMLAGFAFLIKDWRTLVITITAPLGFALLTWWWIPESARWLLGNGKEERTQFYLDRCAKFNKRQKVSPGVIHEIASDMESVAKTNYTYLHLIKTPKMRQMTLVLGIVWFGLNMTYYGISLNIVGFGLNMYLIHLIYAAIEVPAKLMTYWLVDIVGRRWYEAGTLLLTGVCVAINMFVPEGLWYVRAVVAIVGKGLSEASFTTVYLYTNELYPTVLRQNGLSFTFFIAHLGGSMSPLFLPLEDVWSPLPQTIFCSFAIVCGLLTLLLPETQYRTLPETVDDIEKP